MQVFLWFIVIASIINLVLQFIHPDNGYIALVKIVGIVVILIFNTLLLIKHGGGINTFLAIWTYISCVLYIVVAIIAGSGGIGDSTFADVLAVAFCLFNVSDIILVFLKIFSVI